MWVQQLGYQETDFTVDEINHLLTVIEPGDILGSYESGRLTSWFIKGEFDHVAIVNENLYVVEAVGDKYVPKKFTEAETIIEIFSRVFLGRVNEKKMKNIGGVRKVPLEKWLWTKNHIFIARHKDRDAAKLAAVESNQYVGRGYDYSFSEGSEKLFCSEIPYICFKKFDAWLLNRVPDSFNILPIDYLYDSNLKIVYNSRP